MRDGTTVFIQELPSCTFPFDFSAASCDHPLGTHQLTITETSLALADHDPASPMKRRKRKENIQVMLIAPGRFTNEQLAFHTKSFARSYSNRLFISTLHFPTVFGSQSLYITAYDVLHHHSAQSRFVSHCHNLSCYRGVHCEMGCELVRQSSEEGPWPTDRIPHGHLAVFGNVGKVFLWISHTNLCRPWI